MTVRSLLLACWLIAAWACESSSERGEALAPPNPQPEYLNHSDTAKYVGMTSCRSCHQEIYNSFLQTGMGKSFDLATREKSSADFTSASLHDRFSGFSYNAYWRSDSLWIAEWRLLGRDTAHRRSERVNFIIGSGQHTNSHLYSVNGYVHQMPMTYYTQKKKWDLPPGFENGVNTRFTRKIGLECMTCHNAFPGFVMGSENKYTRVPRGIDCERCHGPGSIHVAERSTGSRVDTSLAPDYSIVNPKRLSLERQIDICQRCHLQGNAVLKEGKSFFDFRPGQKLSDFISVFVPRYSGADDDFIMASHADRLRQSPCFLKSKPAPGAPAAESRLTCITCHDPHVSVKHTSSEVFTRACLNCHATNDSMKTDLGRAHKGINNTSDCISCHMPVSGSNDIPHVTIHDHFIRKPVTGKEKEKIRQFVGLYSVNDRTPDALTRATAYLQQYERYEQHGYYLDSAARILSLIPDDSKLAALVHLYFIRKDHERVIAVVRAAGEDRCLRQIFVKQSYSNEHAWTSYRIAEAFLNTGQEAAALRWLENAVKLAPFNPDFGLKLGTTLAAGGRSRESADLFEKIIAEHPRFTAAYTNLGYLRLVGGFPAEALRLYRVAEGLDPDNEVLLLNLGAYYSYINNKKEAEQYFRRVLKVNPANDKARLALSRLNS